jgi:glucokinase
METMFAAKGRVSRSCARLDATRFRAAFEVKSLLERFLKEIRMHLITYLAAG